jgi:periplasmic divalent cation tolerance protein
MNNEKIIVFMTSDDEQVAARIAEGLLAKRQAACVGIFPRGKSFYWWEGKIDSAEEFLLIAKTRRDLLEKLIETVKGIHNYEVPEIIAVPAVGGSGDYLKWIDEVTAN